MTLIMKLIIEPGRLAKNYCALGLSVAATVSFLLLGVWYFRRMERGFADVI